MRSLMCALAIVVIAATNPGLSRAADAQEEAIAQRIAANLKSSGRMQSYKIGVAYKEGTAWLNGSVASQQQLKSALEIVRETEGVENVVNRISIEPASEANSGGIQLTASEGTAPAAIPSNRRVAARQMPSQGSAPSRKGAAPVAYARMNAQPMAPMGGAPMPAHVPGAGGGGQPVAYDQPNMPGYAWPSYASYPNYAALTYPKQYSPTAWPYIGPFYPYPQVPLGWRKVTLEWDDGWWMLDFKEH